MDRDSRAPGFLAWVALTSSFALFLVCLRIYVRLGVVHRFGTDDLTILIAAVGQDPFS